MVNNCDKLCANLCKSNPPEVYLAHLNGELNQQMCPRCCSNCVVLCALYLLQCLDRQEFFVPNVYTFAESFLLDKFALFLKHSTYKCCAGTVQFHEAQKGKQWKSFIFSHVQLCVYVYSLYNSASNRTKRGVFFFKKTAIKCVMFGRTGS